MNTALKASSTTVSKKKGKRSLGRRILRFLSFIATGLLGLFLALFIYYFFMRPGDARWGATDEEVERVMPGDELIPHAAVVSTQAIGINASAEKVWPWLVQIGKGRGGLYSYDWLENLFLQDIHSVDHILPEYQNLKPGDTISIGSPPPVPVYAVDPINHALVLGDSKFSTWVLAVYPVDESHSRLLIRYRDNLSGLYHVVFDPATLTMTKEMLVGIRDRAEKNS
ncbi:MAG TPA: hypothetical protein VH186_28830 [Chloroflexia bacterium]|nr:hypothetical protein [Chloroflexia bacterium]